MPLVAVMAVVAGGCGASVTLYCDKKAPADKELGLSLSWCWQFSFKWVRLVNK